MRIETSFAPGTGIRYLLEANESQIVAVDTHRTLKFYEFIDKSIKEENERVAKEEEEIIKGLKELFEKYDADQNGLLTFDEFAVMAQDLCQTVGVGADFGKSANAQWSKDHENKLRNIFNTWDEDGSNYLTKAEMRPIVKKMIGQGFQFQSPTKKREVE